jgi:ubiquinone/menaquinone biosynthesis C-methylase UbiE
MTVLDIGCAMGFFALPLARLVGPHGSVVCVDVQEKMITVLDKRARNAGLSDRIETRRCTEQSLGLDDLRERVDFAFASAVVHEVASVPRFFSETHEAIRPGGRFLVIEPKGHVTEKDFEHTVLLASGAGFKPVGMPKMRCSRAALLEK